MTSDKDPPASKLRSPQIQERRRNDDAKPQAAKRGLPVSRRHLLIGGALGGAGAAAAATRHDGVLGASPQEFRGSMPWTEGGADFPPGVQPGSRYVYFTAAEAAFIEPAVERLIPSDSVGPGALQAGVPIFIDRQLAGQYGQGQHFFLGGPWPKGTPEQGYQSRFTPAQLYRNTIPAIETYVSGAFSGASFAKLGPADQDRVLKGLESGSIQLAGGAEGKSFFTMLLQNTKEGYFADPIYGGNRDMGGWKMIGFPGAHYDYREWVSRHGQRVPYPPVGFLGRPGWNKV